MSGVLAIALVAARKGHNMLPSEVIADESNARSTDTLVVEFRSVRLTGTPTYRFEAWVEREDDE